MLDLLVHGLNLPIGLRSSDQREDLLDLEVVLELLEFFAVELCSIIGYDGVGYSILADNVLVDKLRDHCRHDGCKRFCFNPFSEVVNNAYCTLPLSLVCRSIRSIPHMANGHILVMDISFSR